MGGALFTRIISSSPVGEQKSHGSHLLCSLHRNHTNLLAHLHSGKNCGFLKKNYKYQGWSQNVSGELKFQRLATPVQSDGRETKHSRNLPKSPETRCRWYWWISPMRSLLVTWASDLFLTSCLTPRLGQVVEKTKAWYIKKSWHWNIVTSTGTLGSIEIKYFV